MITFRMDDIPSEVLEPMTNINGPFLNDEFFIMESFNDSKYFPDKYLADFREFLKSLPSNGKMFWIKGFNESDRKSLRDALSRWNELNLGDVNEGTLDKFIDSIGMPEAVYCYITYLSDLHKTNIFEFCIEHTDISMSSTHYVFDPEDKLLNSNEEELISYINKISNKSKIHSNEIV